jgi:hypothetical protein
MIEKKRENLGARDTLEPHATKGLRESVTITSGANAAAFRSNPALPTVEKDTG